jgi:hypothetical protein
MATSRGKDFEACLKYTPLRSYKLSLKKHSKRYSISGCAMVEFRLTRVTR